MARRLGHRAARSDFGDSQSARFSHGRCGRAATGSGSRGAPVAAKLLRKSRHGLSRSPRSPARHPHGRRIPMLQAAWRLLHHDGHQRLRLPGRRRVRKISGERYRRGCRSRIKFLSQSCGRPHAPAFHILQDGNDIPGRRRAARQTQSKLARFAFCGRPMPMLESARFHRGDDRMAMEFDLISPGTKLTANGEGEAHEISSSATRTFMCWIEITDQIEQESVDISIYGSEDGQAWGKMPLLKMPQRFYRGDTRQILDLSMKPEIRFLRAKWELARWGRVAPHPMFVMGFRLTEVPAFVQQAATR